MEVRSKGMENIIQQTFSRQYKRMETELKSVNIPNGYLTIVSKYWAFCEKDIRKELGNEQRCMQTI